MPAIELTAFWHQGSVIPSQGELHAKTIEILFVKELCANEKEKYVSDQTAADSMGSTDTEVTEGDSAEGKCRMNLGVRS